MNPDCILYILRFVNDGCLYKSLLFTCKLFRDFYYTGFKKGGELWNHIRFVRKFSNHLLTLIKMYPKKEWSWDSISSNPNITWEFVRKHRWEPNWHGQK